MLAMMVRIPEMRIDESEAAKLSKGIANVARHYDVTATQKTIDWSNLVMVLAMIYGTRMMAIGARRKADRQKQREERGEVPTVIDFGLAKSTQKDLQ